MVKVFRYDGEPEVEDVERDAITNATLYAIIVIGWEGFRRYRARFSPNPKRKGQHVRIGNKQRFKENGQPDASNISIPGPIFLKMRRFAHAIIFGVPTPIPK
jgi:hypothetical protein